MESKFKDEEIRSVSPAPAKSVLIKAQQNVFGTVAEVAVAAAEVTQAKEEDKPAYAKGGRLTKKLV